MGRWERGNADADADEEDGRGVVCGLASGSQYPISGDGDGRTVLCPSIDNATPHILSFLLQYPVME